MPDEFPTLEAVAALGVLALLLRTLLIVSEIGRLPKFTSEFLRVLSGGDPNAALSICDEPAAPALARSARQLIAAVGETPYDGDAAVDLEHERAELEQDLGRRAESGRARDLIVLAVLLGAMAFAFLSNLHVTRWFHFLATIAALLLIIGYVMRLRLRVIEQRELERVAVGLLQQVQSAAGRSRARPSLHSIDGGCRVCGETLFLVAPEAALGTALPALSIHELRICKNCGFVSGQAEDAAVLGRAALEELRVPVDVEREPSSDDTEHDG